MPEHQNFETDLHEACLRIIEQAIPVFREKAEKICYYCYVTESSCSCSIFALKDGKPYQPRHIGIPEEAEQSVMDCKLIMDRIGKLCKRYSHPALGEIRIAYDLTSDTLEVSVGGEKNWQQMSRGKADWMLEFHHANAALRPDANRPAKKLPPLKREWQYKIKGLRDVCIGWDAVCKDGTLTYFITANSKDRHYYHDCHLMQLDMETMEAESLFMCHGICRESGCRMDGRMYFSSLTGEVYCLDERTWETIWKTEMDGTNLKYNVFADETSIYVSGSKEIYCLDRADGRIRWQIDCSFYIAYSDADHLYCMKVTDRERTLCCIRKSDAEVLWMTELEEYIHSKHMAEQNQLLFHTENNYVLIDLRTGAQADRTGKMPEYLYYGDNAADIHCMKLCENGTLSEIYCRHVDSEVEKVVPDGERLWAVTRCGYLYLMDIRTGEDLRKPKKASEEACNIIPYADGAILMSNKGQVEYFR